MSQELSSCIDSVSVETRESESVTRIREFQRNALMKLSGKLNFSQLYDLERELSNVSINSVRFSSFSFNIYYCIFALILFIEHYKLYPQNNLCSLQCYPINIKIFQQPEYNIFIRIIRFIFVVSVVT